MHTQPQHDPECGRNGKQDKTTQLQLFSFFVLSIAMLLWKNCGVICPAECVLQMLEMHRALISKRLLMEYGSQMWKKWKTKHNNTAAALQLLCSLYCHVIVEKLWCNTSNLMRTRCSKCTGPS